MKQLTIILVLFLPSLVYGQTIEATLLYNWQDSSITTSGPYNSPYNEVWGVVANDQEFAVLGTKLGTHFFNVTDPNNATELPNTFVAGGAQGSQIIHRDFHDYQCYLYAVCDEGFGSTLQIIDYSDLPNSTTVVYDSDVLFSRAHNIFIDTATAKLYACGVDAGVAYFGLQVYSLNNPTAPTLLASYGNLDGYNLPTVHDIYVRNDTAFLNLGIFGLLVVDFSDMVAPRIIGSLDSYTQQGYNHSGWLSDDGQYYFMADETHGTDVKTVDVSDLDAIAVVDTFDADSPEPASIPHNLIVRGNYLYVSYYYDGLQVYDISDPTNVARIAFYDTHPEPNFNSYQGAWGVFPYLPSGNILVSDMQRGLYVFERIDLGINGDFPPLGSPMNCASTVSITPTPPRLDIDIYPQPFQHTLTISIADASIQQVQIELWDVTGRRAYGPLQRESNDLTISGLDALLPGVYVLQITGDGFSHTQRIVRQ